MDDFSYDAVKRNFHALTFQGKPLIPDLFTFAKATPVIEIHSKEEIVVSVLFEIYDKTIERKEVDLLFDGPPPGFIHKNRLFYIESDLSYAALLSLPKKILPEEIKKWPGALILGELPQEKHLFFTDYWGITASVSDPQHKEELVATAYRPHPSREKCFTAPKESVFSSVELLFAAGWKIFDHLEKEIIPLTHVETRWSDKHKALLLEGSFHFASTTLPITDIPPHADRIALDKERVGLLPEGLTFSPIQKREDSCIELPKRALYQLLTFQKKPLLPPQKEPNITPSSEFLGTLRDYQLTGMRFLYAHYQLGASALLADDMGLGKTIQTLAFLSCLPQKSTILLIAPTTLLFNWEREIEKFLPSRKNDIVLASYAVIRANSGHFAATSWDILILDEAQAIKNKETQTHQKACSLPAQFRLSLSGTPIENQLSELHNHFAFLLPEESFSSDMTLLKKETAPYILRRRKKEVLPELPEKIEENLYLPLLPKQAEAYLHLTEQFRKECRDKPLGILEAILRLRQLALHPQLIGLPLDESVKLERLLADIEENRASGLKVAVFSQFTSFLHIAHAHLAPRLPTLLLDGTTPNRDKVVDLFQNDPDFPLLLMSLKVGGVGLNLTRADTVILLDPWWNEAQEDQAISRAHRMGRKGTVLARKYIAQGTIEEKMVLLKEKKRALSDYILEGEPLPPLNENELFSLLN